MNFNKISSTLDFQMFAVWLLCIDKEGKKKLDTLFVFCFVFLVGLFAFLVIMFAYNIG